MATGRDNGSQDPTLDRTLSYPFNLQSDDPRHFDTRPGAADDLSWADAQEMNQWSERMIFYREVTPPPPTNGIHRGRMDSSTIPSKEASWFRKSSYDHVAPPAPIPTASTICGLRRRIFWIIVCAASLAVAIAVGVGVGVGTSQSSNAPEAASASPTTTSSTVSAQPTDTAQLGSSACPGANGTTYQVAQSSKTFLRICGIDYSGEGGATDLGIISTASMQDCINSCAGYPDCTGCSWGVVAGDAGIDHRCWLKNNLQQPRAARSGWDFAILQQ